MSLLAPSACGVTSRLLAGSCERHVGGVEARVQKKTRLDAEEPKRRGTAAEAVAPR